MPLGGAKDGHFSCFHSSCQLRLRLKAMTFLLTNVTVQINKTHPLANHSRVFCRVNELFHPLLWPA